MFSSGWMIAVTYLEWIRWVATGRLRCSDRVTWVSGAEDQAGFDALMDRASDLNVGDDHGYVLAGFCQGAPLRFEPAQSGAGLGTVWMPIDVVASFYPLSERGKRLLEADAVRANVRLEEPHFEARWADWQRRRRGDLARQRAAMLCKALNLAAVVADDSVPESVLGILSGLIAPPNAERAESLRGSISYGWALSFAVFSELAGPGARQEFSKRFGLGNLLTGMERAYAPGKPVMQSPAIPAALEMTRHLKEACGVDLPVVLVAVVLHYRHFLTTDRPVSLEALLEDLTALGVRYGPKIAALAAQSVATAMDDAAVTTLMYQAMPEAFPALTHTRPRHTLDIGARIAALKVVHPEDSDGCAVESVSLPQGAAEGARSPEEKNPDLGSDAAVNDSSPTTTKLGEVPGSMPLCIAVAQEVPKDVAATDLLTDVAVAIAESPQSLAEDANEVASASTPSSDVEAVLPPISTQAASQPTGLAEECAVMQLAGGVERSELEANSMPDLGMGTSTRRKKKKLPTDEAQVDLEIDGEDT